MKKTFFHSLLVAVIVALSAVTAQGALMRVVMSLILPLSLGLGFGAAPSAYADFSATWNGHTYLVVFADNPTWFEARDAAAVMTLNGVSGHLATFVTRDEQESVIGQLGGGATINSLWLGGYQDTSAPDYLENYGGWKWITGEPWLGVATNDPLLPRSDFGFNNTYFDYVHTEEYTITWWQAGGINDYYHSPSATLSDASGGPSRGFIVEFDPELTIPVTIDIKPGSFPNSINPRSKGLIPVAILTTDTFDTTAVDTTTVLFGQTGTQAVPVQFAFEDIDGDGNIDIILHFNTQNTGIECGDTVASLTGETFGGQVIKGADSVGTVGCK